VSEQVTCPNCGWANQAGQEVCSWCRSPLPGLQADEPDSSTLVIPPAFGLGLDQPGEPALVNLYRGSDDRFYTRFGPSGQRQHKLTPVMRIIAIVLLSMLLFPLLAVVLGYIALVAMCSASAQGGSQSIMDALANKWILYLVGTIAIILCALFMLMNSARRSAD